MPEPVTLVVRMRARGGQEDALRAALEDLTERTRQEGGVQVYDLHVGVDDPARFVFYERWDSAEAHAAHDRTPHVVAFRERIPDLLDGEPQVDRLRRIS